MVHDGFVEVTGRFLYNLAFFRPPVEEEGALPWCRFALLAIDTCAVVAVLGGQRAVGLLEGHAFALGVVCLIPRFWR